MIPDLGKYAVAVVSAYGVTIALILVLIGVSLRQSIRTRQALREVENARMSKEVTPDTKKETELHG
ncbi:heme exporter protein CcmD [Tropicimonas sp. IMCC34043]|uniref:heme exporter protein CcmD n=1 Tax=Tropicimonas sp. IMCC34043 TaxID=2248760 RepID=UPI000E21FDEC|nr:heme exporter protein CcmD [Tropicimonas sp. IMCC34043]